VQSANSRPPPRAREDTALMVGMGRVERAVNVARRSERNFAVLLHSKKGNTVSKLPNLFFFFSLSRKPSC